MALLPPVWKTTCFLRSLQLPTFGATLRWVASLSNFFDLPVAFLQPPHPPFRNALPSFDPHKEETMPGLALPLSPCSHPPHAERRAPLCTCYSRLVCGGGSSRADLLLKSSDARPASYLAPGSGGYGIYFRRPLTLPASLLLAPAIDSSRSSSPALPVEPAAGSREAPPPTSAEEVRQNFSGVN